MKFIRKRLTYSNVMSSIAVFLILGGATAFAASQLGKNSVGTKQLKKNAVTTAKIKNSAVTTNKIKNGAVTGCKGESELSRQSSERGECRQRDQRRATPGQLAGMTVSKITYAANSGSGPQVVLNTQGLVLTANCVAGTPTVVATASVPSQVRVEFNSEAITTGNVVSNVADDGNGHHFHHR